MFPFDDEDYKDTLSMADPQLPMLASQAAIELDNIILGNDTGIEATGRLANLLKTNLTQDSYMNAATSVVIGRAIHRAGTSQRPKTISDLLAKTLDLAGHLGQSSSASPIPTLEEMRDFCAALSLAAGAHIRQLASGRSTNPARR